MRTSELLQPDLEEGAISETTPPIGQRYIRTCMYLILPMTRRMVFNSDGL